MTPVDQAREALLRAVQTRPGSWRTHEAAACPVCTEWRAKVDAAARTLVQLLDSTPTVPS